MSVKNGGPAFPTVDANREEDYGTYGMSLRDYFAAQALVAVTKEHYERLRGDMDEKQTPHPMDIATSCYVIADCMLMAREVKS